jgi:hypothetical protein
MKEVRKEGRKAAMKVKEGKAKGKGEKVGPLSSSPFGLSCFLGSGATIADVPGFLYS